VEIGVYRVQAARGAVVRRRWPSFWWAGDALSFDSVDQVHGSVMDHHQWTPICMVDRMTHQPPDRRPAPVPRPANAPKRPRVKQRQAPVHTTDLPEAPQPDRGVATGITG